MTANGDRLPYGLADAVPAKAPAAWGARMIVTQDGHVDLVPDRMGAAGEDREAFLALLDAEFPIADMVGEIRELLKSGEMDTRQARDFTIYTSDTIEVRANTNASAGYCYVAAWLKEGVELP